MDDPYQPADVYVAVTLKRVSSDIAASENMGRKLTEIALVLNARTSSERLDAQHESSPSPGKPQGSRGSPALESVDYIVCAERHAGTFNS
jgi:hypothetical protein